MHIYSKAKPVYPTWSVVGWSFNSQWSWLQAQRFEGSTPFDGYTGFAFEYIVTYTCNEKCRLYHQCGYNYGRRKYHNELINVEYNTAANFLNQICYTRIGEITHVRQAVESETHSHITIYGGHSFCKSHNMALFLEDNGNVFLILEDPFNAVSSHYWQLQYNHNYNLDGNQAILTGVSETSCCCSGEKEKGQGEIIRWIVRKGSTGNIHGNALTRENPSLGHVVPLLPFPIKVAMVKIFIKEYLFRQL